MLNTLHEVIPNINREREKKGKEIKHPLSTRGVFSIEYPDVEIKVALFLVFAYTQQNCKKKARDRRFSGIELATFDGKKTQFSSSRPLCSTTPTLPRGPIKKYKLFFFWE